LHLPDPRESLVQERLEAPVELAVADSLMHKMGETQQRLEQPTSEEKHSMLVPTVTEMLKTLQDAVMMHTMERSYLAMAILG